MKSHKSYIISPMYELTNAPTYTTHWEAWMYEAHKSYMMFLMCEMINVSTHTTH